MKRRASLVAFVLALGAGACSWIAGIDEIHMASDDGGASVLPDGGGPIATGDGDVSSDAASDALDVDAVAAAGAVDADAGRAMDGGCEAGATAFKGECYPKVIASGLAQPISLAVVGGSVVWAENAQGTAGAGAVRSCPVGGCAGAPHDLFTNLTRPRIRQAGAGGVPVLYDLGGAIGIAEIASGTATTKITAAQAVTVAAASATYAVWQSDALYVCARANCTAQAVTLPSAHGVQSGGPFSVEGDRLYAALANGGFGSCTLPSCSDLVPYGADTFTAMINDGAGAVYVPASGPQLAVFVPQGAVEPGATLPTAALNAFNIFADGTSAFLAAPSGVYGGLRASGQTLTQRSTLPARDVATDNTFVYWVEHGTGRVMVAPR